VSILENLWIIPLLPLLGSAINGLFGAKWSKAIVNSVALGSTGVSFLCAVEAVREFLGYYEANHKAWVKPFFPWIIAGEFRVGFDLQIDRLTVVMLLVVTGVGWLIHIYSLGYMAHEGGYYRFFSYLNLFMFFMLILVLAANYVLLFVGWEGVGLSSYLLIGFYFLRKSAADAGKKAFIVNRIGDFGFMLGMFLLFKAFGTLDLVPLFSKPALAYAADSQLGYMFLALGVGPFSAGIFHLMTHAFFKALLFLAAGSVIHAMGGEQDMTRMGGLSKKIHWTYLTMLTATLAIAGFPPLAGFFSKDSILLNAYQSEHGGRILYAFGLLTALLTSFYMFRLIFLTFFGKPRFDEHKVHVHESPKSMLIPLVILALLSIIGGWVAAPAFWGAPDYFAKFLEPVFAQGGVGNAEAAEATAHALETPLAVVAVITALLGFAIAFWLYLKQPGKPEQLAKSMRGAYNTLLNKYYVDEIYAALIVKPLLWLSTNVPCQTATARPTDGTVNGIAEGLTGIADGFRPTQSGNTRSYAVWVVIGALVIIAIIFWPHIRPATVGVVR